MANDAVRTQLPIMVRRPRAVWPGLDRMDLHRKQIAGDGNCLFASLADQLYGNPDQHLEIRAAVIDHMRTYRPLFESFAIKDDIQQKRATRAATNARNTSSDDTFEDYLAIMCRLGTYGGEPELMAFVQCYDQDVLVHLPHMEGYPEAIPYTNQYRLPEAEIKPQLHLCYGGDEVTFPHYDSARKNTPPPTEISLIEHSKRTTSFVPAIPDTSGNGRLMTARAIRNSRSDISRDLMHDMIIKGSKELRSSFDDAERARSPSASSHQSSSSKRSFDDDGEPQRASKRADRRKSTRIRGTLDHTLLSQPRNLRLNLSTYSQPATPQSTQSSDYSSDQSEHGAEIVLKCSQDPESGSFVATTQATTSDLDVKHPKTPPDEHEISDNSAGRSMITERQRSMLQA